MNLFSHITISKILYNNLSQSMELDKHTFTYGNIMPDLESGPYDAHHTLENYLYFICLWSKNLMKQSYSVKEFSLRLGMICHFVSDFFCEYHLNEERCEKRFEHAIYEQRLHRELRRARFAYSVHPEKQTPRNNIAEIIMELRADYLRQPASMKKDIEFALLATTWICESVHCYSYQAIPTSMHHLPNMSYLQMPSVEGGKQ